MACAGIFHLEEADKWLIEAGRSLLADLLMAAEEDPRDVLEAYDAMMVFVSDANQRFKMAAEAYLFLLQSKSDFLKFSV